MVELNDFLGVSSGGLIDEEAGVEDSDINIGDVDFGKIEIEDIIPDKGKFLALDVSKNSTGITVIDDHNIGWNNISLMTNVGETHGEALMRREFNTELRKYIAGDHFDVIIVEDVFTGSQINGVRSLYALNTVIDDLILDGIITCDKFIRVQNGTWKHWLKELDPDNLIRANNDKQMIAGILKLVGVNAEGKGAQDRLDSIGMLTGYFLVERGIAGQSIQKKVNVSNGIKIKDIHAEYVPNKSTMEAQIRLLTCEVDKFRGRVTEKAIIEAVTQRPEMAFYTPNIVSIGLLSKKLNVPSYPFGGYLMFYLKDED